MTSHPALRKWRKECDVIDRFRYCNIFLQKLQNNESFFIGSSKTDLAHLTTLRHSYTYSLEKIENGIPRLTGRLFYFCMWYLACVIGVHSIYHAL